MFCATISLASALAPFALLTSAAATPESQRPIPISSSNKGLSIPSVGLGLWNSKDKDATHAVEYAFDAGYDHFDSAAAYSTLTYL